MKNRGFILIDSILSLQIISILLISILGQYKVYYELKDHYDNYNNDLISIYE